jgi:hypothetical protein
MTKAARDQALLRRLGPYWKMEMGGAVIIPCLVLAKAFPRTPSEVAAVALSLLGVSSLLLIGGAYWFGVLQKAKGQPSAHRAVMRIADRTEWPVILLLAAAWAASAVAFATSAMSRPVIAALGCSALATLEYVNYYKVQLQNFDHAPDLKRLLSGRGFRRAHLGRDLAALRRGTSITPSATLSSG